MASEIRNPQLWQDGRLKIDWGRHHMPLLNGREEEFRRDLPFKGLKVATEALTLDEYKILEAAWEANKDAQN